MLRLPDVTLCCIDTANHALALRALTRSQTEVEFARTLLLTDGVPAGIAVPESVEVVPIRPLASRDAYSQLVLKSLGSFIRTSHVLLVQWDGYVVNPEAWTPEFLACDYLGAKWFWYDDDMRVGNGGFSLRSARLLDALQDARIVLHDNEDTTIGRSYRRLLEREHGLTFGSEALADRFSFEAAYPIGKPFGFHGLFNFCRTVPPTEIAAMAPTFSDAIAGSPQLLQLMRNCAALGQWQAVAAIAQRILEVRPDDAEVAASLQNARAQAAATGVVGRNEPCPCGSGRKYKQCHGALGAATKASAAPPVAATPDAVAAQGVASHRSGDIDSAETAYRRVLELDPGHAVAMHYLGVVHYQRRRFAQALPLLQRAVEVLPAEPEFHNNLGLALAALDRNDEAIAAYRRTLSLKPEHAVAWNNLGLAFTALNHLADAVAAYRNAIARAPQFGQAHWNLALALLAMGQYEEGWREYEWRLGLPELGKSTATHAGARWDGRIRQGARLLLIAEQGLGDTIQFARFAQPIAAAGMHVVLQAPAAVKRLLGTISGVEAVVAPEDPVPAHDAHLPLLSLPGALRVDRDSIRGPAPYIRADPRRVAGLRDDIAATPGRLRIGISWAGSPLHTNDARRSIPFDRLAGLLTEREVAWFSLQRGETHGAPLIEWPARDALDDTAALIAGLDLIVTVDTSIAHLAGALHRPTWLLLSYASDWRWGVEGSATPWYPSMRLFRQPAIGDWAGLLREVGAALTDWLAGHP